MSDILMDTVIDSLKLIPFLFIAFLIIELIEHKLSDKSKQAIEKSGKFGPLLGSILGIFPQCGFSVLVTNLYVTRIVSMGTLIAVYLSTSDEMLPVLLSTNVNIKTIIVILSLKLAIGMVFGLIIDSILKKQEKEKVDYEICHDENCHCNEHLILSVIKHTLHITLFIFIATLVLNFLIEYTGIGDADSIILNNIFTPFLTSLIGLIPNCASSVLITTLYTNSVISFASLISGLLTGSGVALLVLFKTNKNLKENISILGIIYFIGSLMGFLIEILGVAI